MCERAVRHWWTEDGSAVLECLAERGSACYGVIGKEKEKSGGRGGRKRGGGGRINRASKPGARAMQAANGGKRRKTGEDRVGKWTINKGEVQSKTEVLSKSRGGKKLCDEKFSRTQGALAATTREAWEKLRIGPILCGCGAFLLSPQRRRGGRQNSPA